MLSWKINFETIDLLQKANLNKSLLLKGDLNEKVENYKKDKTIYKIKNSSI